MYQENKYKISDSEWVIMNAIWNLEQPIYMRDIVNALSDTPWSRTTIQTMVSRLLTKKIIDANRKRYAFEYFPAVERKDALRAYTDTIIKRVYDEDPMRLVNEVLEGNHLDAEQKKELKKIL